MKQTFYQQAVEQRAKLMLQVNALDVLIDTMAAPFISDDVPEKKTPPPVKKQKKRVEKSGRTINWEEIFPLITGFISKNGEVSGDEIAEAVREEYPDITEKNIKANGLWRMKQKGLIVKMGTRTFGLPGSKVKADKPKPYKERKKQESKNDIEEEEFDDKKHFNPKDASFY